MGQIALCCQLRSPPARCLEPREVRSNGIDSWGPGLSFGFYFTAEGVASVWCGDLFVYMSLLTDKGGGPHHTTALQPY